MQTKDSKNRTAQLTFGTSYFVRALEKQKRENFVKKNHRFVDSEIVKTCDELDPG